MRLEWIELENFRSYPRERAELHARANLLLGPNGMGKTNFLEAIYVLATAVGLHGHKSSDLIREGCERTRVAGVVEQAPGAEVELAVAFEKGHRELLLRGKAVEKAVEYFGNLEVVAFTPQDVQLFAAAPSERRRYLDRVIFNHEPGYLDTARRFRRVLAQRNRLLGEIDEGRRSAGELAAWDSEYARLAAEITRRRAEMVEVLREGVEEVYASLFAAAPVEPVSLRYRSELLLLEEDPSPESILLWLEEKRRRDIRRGSTELGPHRDDLVFEVHGQPVRTHASQGQKRTLILAVKLAEVLSLTERRARGPVVLLDDLSSELDATRTESVLKYLLAQGSQLFITSTAEGPWGALLSDGCAHFEVHEGRLEPLLA